MSMYEQALKRPSNFDMLPAREQWLIDSKLGIIGWDGTDDRPACKRQYVIREGDQKMNYSFTTTFTFGDAVSIDGGSVTACVIGFSFYPHGHQVQVSWWNNGALVEQWVADWRLKLLEKK